MELGPIVCVEQAKELFRGLWMEALELEREIEMERDLCAALRENGCAFAEMDIDRKVREMNLNGGLLNQVKKYVSVVKNYEREAKRRCEIEQKIRCIVGENERLEREVNELADRVINIDVNDVRALREQKLQIEKV